jgi:signal peptidase II
MKLVSRAGVLAFALAATVAVLDQAAKSWIVDGLRLVPGESQPVFGPLRLTLVENAGVSFGLLQSGGWARWALAGFALAVAAALSWWVRRSERLYTGVALGLVIGGAIGNFLDRVRFGTVVDFVDVTALWFPWIFNLADGAITIGIVLLLIESFFFGKREAA